MEAERERVLRQQAMLRKVLTELHALYHFTTVISGRARGADRRGEDWAHNHAIPIDPYPADWGRFKNGAGPIRNKEMLEKGKPDLVVAFPGGNGTFNMIDQALHAYVEVIEVAGDGKWRKIGLENWLTRATTSKGSMRPTKRKLQHSQE